LAVNVFHEYGELLDCHTCDEKLREERGHDKAGIIGFRIGRERIFRCPLMLITPLTYEYVKAFSFYEKSILPNGKGWQEESQKYTQAMLVLDSEFSKIRNKENKDGANRIKHSSKSN